jgi:tetratricopeptide (TPR) repeat protein
VELRYDRPAQYEIPESIRKIGIAEFGGQDAQDVEWGNMASDCLASKLDAYNKQFQRYQLVDRKRLKAILDEQDLQAAFSDSTKAVEAGKIANVDAMIYGHVHVVTRDEQATRTTFDIMNRSTRQVHYTKRYVMAAVTFTMDDVETSKTLVTLTATREFDSEKDANSSRGARLVKMVGMGGGNLPASEQILKQLIDECVQEFVAKISPHQVVESEKLCKGKSSEVETGNKLAAAGDYAEALEAYQSALKTNPDDHEVMFNCGVVSEALGKLAEAEKFYDEAFKLKPKEQYLHARRRVRLEGENN